MHLFLVLDLRGTVPLCLSERCRLNIGKIKQLKHDVPAGSSEYFEMTRRRSEDRNAYGLYDGEGKDVGYRDMLAFLAGADVILFGELHDSTKVHRLEIEITTDLFEVRKTDLIMGAEMFEADNQVVLDEYLSGLILHKHLVTEAKVWGNYETDYRPLVDFAREQGLKFVATNIPRRYASLVAREGIHALERLSEEARRCMAPLPITVDLETPGYREMMTMNLGMGHGMQMEPENLVAAQAVKDATMAYFILANRSAGNLFIHFNGVYHSQGYGGIFWHLKRSAPGLAVKVVSAVQGSPRVFEEAYRGLGDMVMVVPPAR